MKKITKQCIPMMLTSLAAAFVLLYHGVPKLIDPSGTMQGFASMGFPGFLGPIVGLAEVAAAIMIITGFKGKIGALIGSVIIAVALLFVQMPRGITAGFERDLLLLTILVSLYLQSKKLKQ